MAIDLTDRTDLSPWN